MQVVARYMGSAIAFDREIDVDVNDDDDNDDIDCDEDVKDQLCLSQGAQRRGSDPVGACGDCLLRHCCSLVMELVVSVER